jgi:quercetin dioxygenase-like cupin family protein
MANMPNIQFPEVFQQLPAFKSRFDAFQMNGENCKILFATYPPNTDIDAHTHDTFNWGLITRGAMHLTVEGVEKTYSVGEWFNVPLEANHSARCDEATEVIEFWFKPE